MNTQANENKPAPPPEEKPGQQVAERQTGSAMQVVDFGDDAGSGLEHVDRSELRIPFLIQFQPLSPQVKPVSAGGIPGAKPGMLLNGGTGDMFDINDRALPFLPVFRDHKFLEFTPRNLGGGFVAMYEPNDELIIKLRSEQSKFGRLVHNNTKGRNDKGELLDGTEIIESFSLFGIFDPYGNPFRGVLPFKSTQIKKYQNFMGRVTSIKYGNPKSTEAAPLPPVTPPMWAHVWDIKSVFEQNSKGEFYGLNLTLHAKKEDGTEESPIKSLVPRSDALYTEAKAFFEMLRDGKAEADFKTDREGAGVTGDSNTPM